MQTTFLYNHELLKRRAEHVFSSDKLGIAEIVKTTGICRVSVERAFDGRLRTIEKLRAISDAATLPWELLFQERISESQFRRAVKGVR